MKKFLIKLLKCMKTQIVTYETRSEFCNNYWIRVKEHYSKSTVLKKSGIIDELYEQNGITYLIKFMHFDQIKNKEIQIIKHKEERSKDPFEPPIDEGILIDEEFTDSHRLCFNKFPIIPYHTIIATRDYVDQYTHLDLNDISSLLLLIRIINGYGFFNGGMNAGASQPHKHLQVLPYEYNKNYGLFLITKDDRYLENINIITHPEAVFCKIKVFDFNHILVKFSDDLSRTITNISKENSWELGKTVFHLYEMSLNYLELKTDPTKITTNYSFMLNEDWMLIVPRKTHEVKLKNGTLNLNSACYTLSFLVKSEEIMSEIKSLNICDVLKPLSV